MTALALMMGAATFTWQTTDTSLALRNGEKIVWQLVFDANQPKTYFHPLATVDGEVLTALRPADHPWHRGLWWSWKYINKVNYWEEDKKTGKSQGENELIAASAKPGRDFSATAELKFSYHPPGKPAVLTETRSLNISKPDPTGAYRIDWTSAFTVGAAPITLDRTPPHNQGGVKWGGYAGLGVRFPPGIKGWKFLTSEGQHGAAEGNSQPARWVDFSGDQAGIVILDHTGNGRHPSVWYLNEQLPYMSPALLYNEPMELKAHEKLLLRYRVLVHAAPVTPEQLETEWKSFTGR